MTIVSIKRNGDNVSSIKISGHSGYAIEGSDIVCSAVSTATYVSIGLLDKFGVKYDLLEEESQALIEVTLKEDNTNGFIILNNLFDALESIASEYKQYLKIK